MDNKEWLKNQSKQKQIVVYGKAYDLMSFRKAYHGENMTVDDAITIIRKTDGDTANAANRQTRTRDNEQD